MIKFSVKYGSDLSKVKSDLLFALLGSLRRKAPLNQLNILFQKKLVDTLKNEKFNGEKDQTWSYTTLGKFPFKRLHVLGTGEEPEDAEPVKWQIWGAEIAKITKKEKAKSIAIIVPTAEKSQGEIIHALTLGILSANYSFDKYKSKSKKESPKLQECTIITMKNFSKEIVQNFRDKIKFAEHLFAGIKAARDLVNEPPNVLTPEEFAKRAEEMAKKEGLKCEILGPSALKKKGMNMFLAVSSGSQWEPRLIKLTYTPPPATKKRYPKIALVGKGLTFDSGGLNIKPVNYMLGMHADMAGAAAVFGTMLAVARLKPQVEVRGYIGAAENMTGTGAFRVNDILIAANKKSVEVKNTDAEGRLVLGDVLCMASSEKPTEIIDLATLTGACMVALGPYTAGIMGNNPNMVDLLINSGQEYGESLWQLPLLEELKELLKSDVADLSNVGGRYGGAITAGLFLQEFVEKDIHWCHIDIAGPSNLDKNFKFFPKGGTGFGVMTLINYIFKRAFTGRRKLI